MKLKPRKLKNIKPFRECSGCKELTNTRTLNIRYQDFEKTYRPTKYNPNRKGFWIFHTVGYDLCRNCQTKFVKKLETL